MAKKQKNTPLSIEEQMQALAAEIVKDETQLKADKEALEAKKEQLKEWLLADPNNTTDQFIATEQIGGLEWQGAKGKELATKLAQITSALPEQYKKVSLDLESISAALQSDHALYGVISKQGISLARKANTTKLVPKK